ncbi:MAG TPA: hypothetical protein VNW50_17255 [Streptosporangiaceae bacterium]|jgi:hypothetical protein|nr:hypothetical protein [Streptosporangiaceae bacterium]
MRCAADRPAKGCLVSRYGRQVTWLLSICVLAACSSAGSTGHAGKGQAPPGPLARGRVFIVAGPGGGFLAVPGAAAPSGRPKITVPPIPPATSGQTISLPLDSYADVAGLQQTVLAEAQALLTQKCMAARGFVYTSHATPSQEQAVLQTIEYGFGVTSLADASSYGYRQPSSAGGQPPGGIFLGGFSSFQALKQQPPAWTIALIGFAPGARIGPVRQESCMTLADNEVYRPGSSQIGDPVPAIAEQASLWAQTDPRILAVSAAWSRCMAQRGYHYASPQQPADHNWPAQPTAAETAAAVADVTCKQQVNLINTWLAVEAAYQTALIGQDLSTLAHLQAGFQSALKRVEALLADPAGQAPGELGSRGSLVLRPRTR